MAQSNTNNHSSTELLPINDGQNSSSASNTPDIDVDEVSTIDNGRIVETYMRNTKIYLNHESRYASKTRLGSTVASDTAGETRLRAAYWSYLTCRPRELPAERRDFAKEEAMQLLTGYITNGLSSPSSPNVDAPFTLKESQELYGQLKNHYVTSSELELRNALVCWILSNAAVHRNHSTNEPRKDPGQLFKVISRIFFFGVPRNHYVIITRAQKSVWCRGSRDWAGYVSDLEKEWSTFNLAATVLLSASVGFLAIAEIDPISRLSILLSLVSTLGSVMAGVYLLWVHQFGLVQPEDIVKQLEPEDVVLDDSYNTQSAFYDVRLLAIVLSVPSVFLAWGIVSFLGAVVCYSFFSIGLKSSDQTAWKTVTSITISIFSFVVVILTIGVRFTISYHSSDRIGRYVTKNK